MIRIPVRFNNIEQALKKLKKQMQLEGTFKKMKTLKFHESNAEVKIRKDAEAKRRRYKRSSF